MLIKKIALLITIQLLAITQVNAVADYTNKTNLGVSSYSGSACPAKSVVININANKNAIRVKFKNYIVQAKGKSNKSLRKKCNIVIPIQVKKGWSASLISTSYAGKLNLPTGSHASFTNVSTFAGQRGSRFHSNFKNPRNKTYTLHDPLSKFASVWSGCGSATKLRINSSLLLKPNATGTASTVDARQGFVIKLRYRKC